MPSKTKSRTKPGRADAPAQRPKEVNPAKVEVPGAEDANVLPSKDTITQIDVREEGEVVPKAQFVVFQLAGEDYSIPILDAKEIIKMVDITRIPGTSEFILGVINLRGQIIVILDLEKRLGMTTQKPTPVTRLLIAEIDRKLIGMKVDSVSDVRWIAVNDIKPAPKALAKKIELSYLKGVGIQGEKLVIILNLQNLLSSEEKDAIKAIHAAYE